jgi:hypothetical protein
LPDIEPDCRWFFHTGDRSRHIACFPQWPTESGGEL